MADITLQRLKSLLLTASVWLACGAPAYELEWATVDGGGGTEIPGGTMTLSGTAGQPDAGELPGGTMKLFGGFWFPRSATISNTGIRVSQNPAKTGTAITFSSDATQSENQPLVFLWDFGDGALGKGNTVTHAYSTEGEFTVSLTVSDGAQSVTSKQKVSIVAPASGGAPGDNPSTGTTATNPIDGTGIKLVASEGGVLEFETSGVPPGGTVTTVISGPNGTLATITGDKPVYKFTEAGIYTVTSTITDANGNFVGEARITVVESGAGGGEPGTTPPSSKTIVISGVKGKFLFRASKPDVVSFKGSIELPGGLTLGKERVWQCSAGNVSDSVTVDAKGKGRVPGAQARVTKMKVKYPRLKKPATATSAGMRAGLDFTISAADLDLLGFKTEGVTDQVRPDEAALKSVPRTIQVGLLVAGNPYAGQAPVQFKLSKKKDTGQIIPGRTAR